MKTVGIIAEYNPFHNGHKYHIDRAKAVTGADFVIVVMSGSFTQRGLPALVDKFTRTRMALENGADLVLELPVCYATGSAEYFAGGAVALLDRIGVVDSLCFGSECGDISALKAAAETLSSESQAFRSDLQKHLKAGLSYPSARAAALADDSGLLDSPNNILGIEYCKALLKQNSAIRPYTISRKGADYHETEITGDGFFPSARALRQAISVIEDIRLLAPLMPADALSLLSGALHTRCPVYPDDFSDYLHYKLLLESEQGFTDYLDVTEDISRKISKNLSGCSSLSDFCMQLKSKDLTLTRISRCLCHILLNIRTAEVREHMRNGYVPYARMLGLRLDAAPLMHSIKNSSSIPLISRLAGASAILDPPALRLLQEDIRASHIYYAAVTRKFGGTKINEYTQQIVRV